MATAERTKSVTFRSQGADSFGRVFGVWPTLEISSDDSSMKTGLEDETRRGCSAGPVGALTADVEVGRVTK